MFALENLGIAYLGYYARHLPASIEIEQATRDYVASSGGLLIAMGLVFALLNFILAAVEAKPWVWVAGLTNIAGSIICCPPGALLLFVWLKPEVKAFYGITH